MGGFAIMEGNLSITASAILVVTVALLIFGIRMHNPARLKNLYIDQDKINDQALLKLEKEGQIVEWYRNENEKLAIIKYDTQHISEAEIVQAVK